MRIALVAPVFEPVPPARHGGTERRVALLCDALARRGHDVTLFASGDSRVAVPLVAPIAHALRSGEPESDRGRLRRERMAQADGASHTVVLVVEDDPATRSVETIVLEDGGFSVVQANTGEDGLRLAQEQRPGVILLDLALPRMSGFDLLSRLKSTSSTARIPVLLVSAYASLVDNCAQRGASGWVQKPFSRDELLAEVRRVLRPSATRAELRPNVGSPVAVPSPSTG